MHLNRILVSVAFVVTFLKGYEKEKQYFLTWHLFTFISTKRVLYKTFIYFSPIPIVYLLNRVPRNSVKINLFSYLRYAGLWYRDSNVPLFQKINILKIFQMLTVFFFILSLLILFNYYGYILESHLHFFENITF